MAINKMFVMVPLMLAARKLDGEDPNIIFILRCAYFTVQSVIIAMLAFIYIQASGAVNSPSAKKTVYVPPPPQPFADPNAKKKYTETTYGVHLLTAARTLLGSTLFGLAITVGLHFYRGIVMGLAMQTIMGPLSLFESPLFQMYILGKTGRHFDEKYSEELTPEDEIVDAEGNPVPTRQLRNAVASTATATKKTFEDVLLDTWDVGAEADITPLMSALTKETINFVTSESGWTPVMIMSGLGGDAAAGAVEKMIKMGADPGMVDGEGWNALHWAAFHGKAESAAVLVKKSKEEGWHLVKDKEGKTPLDHAEAEGNEDVAVIVRTLEETTKDEPVVETNDEGLRRRAAKKEGE